MTGDELIEALSNLPDHIRKSEVQINHIYHDVVDVDYEKTSIGNMPEEYVIYLSTK